MIYVFYICFSRKRSIISNSQSTREGFRGNSKKLDYKKEDTIHTLVDRKLKGLSEELGGEEGKREMKQLLKNCQKICNLESCKCMMNMVEENKGIKSLDFDSLLDDETSENCIKCQKYTGLSQSIKNMIDSL